MTTYRMVTKVSPSVRTMEGAGVQLYRAVGFDDPSIVDPFLLLDDFHSDDPEDYIAGFPWHPHRGIETVTYMIAGAVEHGDSIGNRGVIESGDVQWMTAGSGIIHQEMPKRWKGMMQGFQLWVNLPAECKMMEPRYREVKADTIPFVKLQPGVTVGVIAGEVGDARGPIEDLVVPCEYFDVQLEPGAVFEHKVEGGWTVFAYTFAGAGFFDASRDKKIKERNLVLFNDEGDFRAAARDEPFRFLLVAGKPLHEPIAWRGPIVMNTEDELKTAFREFNEGTFIKAGTGKSVGAGSGCAYYRT